jgi:hypothetical protein
MCLDSCAMSSSGSRGVVAASERQRWCWGSSSDGSGAVVAASGPQQQQHLNGSGSIREDSRWY